LIEARRKAKTEGAAKTLAENGAAGNPKRTILRKKKTV
jgi:hypothetical protein